MYIYTQTRTNIIFSEIIFVAVVSFIVVNKKACRVETAFFLTDRDALHDGGGGAVASRVHGSH